VADDSNQKGYYEHDQVAALLTSPDKSWLAGARGHSLKVVAPLLAALPLKIQNSESISLFISYGSFPLLKLNL
jgi:hypothetical protein